jgi:putative transposase
MRKSRFSEEQIIGILAEQESGAKVAEVCRRHGVSEQTFYRWKSKFGGMSVPEAKRLKALERENAELKRMVAEQALDIRGLKAALSKEY